VSWRSPLVKYARRSQQLFGPKASFTRFPYR
jgi:hypothetical protein